MPKTAAPKPWRREHAGRYVSADGRFALEGEGGRWFVIDDAERDELGQPRTVGPWPTLDDAKREADALREAPRPASALTSRVKAAGARSRGTGTEHASTADSATPSKPSPSRAAPTRAASPPPPPKPTWLDRLPAADATRARRWIAELARLGLPDPERLVRTEIESNVPAVAKALLARRVRDAALRGVDPAAADAVRRAVAAALEEITGVERDVDAPRDLPGWRLVEHDPARPEATRRIRLGRDDLEP